MVAEETYVVRIIGTAERAEAESLEAAWSAVNAVVGSDDYWVIEAAVGDGTFVEMSSGRGPIIGLDHRAHAPRPGPGR